MMKTKARSRMPALVIAGLLLSSALLFGQDRVTTPNPADIGDMRANLVNPAVIPLQDPLFFVGTRSLHLGVADNIFAARNNMFSLTATDKRLGPFDGLAFGIQGEILNTPPQNNLSLNALLGKRLAENLSLGFSVGVVNEALNLSGVEGLEAGDPLLQESSRWALFNLGAGVIFSPSRYVMLAASANQINRPKLSFAENGDRRLERYITAGGTIGLGYFRGGLSVAQEGDDFMSQVFFEAFKEERGFVKLGYGTESVMLEGQLHVGGGVSLNARYGYPVTELSQASSGSPEISLVFNFKKHGSLYAAKWLDREIPWAPAYSLSNAFQVQSMIDTLYIVDKSIHRQIDPAITNKELADMPRELFFSAEGLEPEFPEKLLALTRQNGAAHSGRMGARQLMDTLRLANEAAGRYRIPEDSLGIITEMKNNHTEIYMQSFRRLAERMKDPNFHSSIVIPPDGRRAYLVLRYLSLYAEVTDRISVIVDDQHIEGQRDLLGATKIPENFSYRRLSAPVDTFKFSLNLEETRRWGPVAGIFMIEDANGNIVYSDSSIVGKSPDNNQILKRLVWDWQVKGGGLPGRGNYYYYVAWRSADRNTYRSPKKRLTVDRKTLPIVIRVSKNNQPAAADARYNATILVH